MGTLESSHGEEEAVPGCGCGCVCVCLGWKYRAETWVRYQGFRVELDNVLSFLLCLNVSMFEHDPHWPRARYKRCGLVCLFHKGTEVGWWCSAESSKESIWRVLNMGLKWDISVVPGTWCLWLDSSGNPFTLQLLVSLSNLILSHHM